MSIRPNTEPQSVEHEIQARTRQLAEAFTVRRLLPSSARRMVGPFIFFDHIGPVQMKAGGGLDVLPHPHINLAAVTYLFDGEILHRDSLGSEQAIRPGAVNWMTAGRGIVHSERSPAVERKTGPHVHGLQLWVALPKAMEETEPSFQHCRQGDIPALELNGVRLRVVTGSAYGATSPVQVSSPLFYVEAQIERRGVLEAPGEYAERALYVVEGSIDCDGVAHAPGTMLVFRERVTPNITALEPSRVMLLGGAPLDGERHIWWNFVSSSRERIEQAKNDWKERRFPNVPGDDVEFVPLPGM